MERRCLRGIGWCLVFFGLFVIRYVPAGSLELKGGVGDDLFNLGTAVDTGGQGFIVHLLQDFEHFLTTITTVFIDRHFAFSAGYYNKPSEACQQIPLKKWLKNHFETIAIRDLSRFPDIKGFHPGKGRSLADEEPEVS
jgi:hypothetical protein